MLNESNCTLVNRAMSVLSLLSIGQWNLRVVVMSKVAMTTSGTASDDKGNTSRVSMSGWMQMSNWNQDDNL